MRIFFTLFILFLGVQPVHAGQSANLSITSPVFQHNSEIPSKYTCDGDNINPPLYIKHVPKYAVSLVLVVHDPDARDWKHWAVYGIEPERRVIEERANLKKEVINDFHQFNYGGPCPPKGETHRYMFDIYALDTNFAINENASVQSLYDHMEGHIMNRDTLVGVYKRR